MNNDGSRLGEIRRAHASARPNPTTNPAWANTHHDLTFVLEQLDTTLLKLRSVEEELVEANQRGHDLIRGGEKILAERDSYALRLDSIRQLWNGHQGIERLLSGAGRHAYDAMMLVRGFLDPATDVENQRHMDEPPHRDFVGPEPAGGITPAALELTCTCGWSSGQCRDDCWKVREWRAKQAAAPENQCPGTIEGNHVPTPGSDICALCRQRIGAGTVTAVTERG